MNRTPATPAERALLVLAVAGLAAAAAQTILLARLLLRLARPAQPSPAPAPNGHEAPTRRWGIGDIAAVPPQDPHSPPTGPLRITHSPPRSTQPPEPAAVAG